ncbi:DUF3574 domain-containing protein [Propylenella binzhouense]|uniref:DUF3574 domain-containing protein n=1 Tax=Propylenella binzhouense TaxID=2555902 RepID=A0A964T2G4_9HYPH|nr:DUF3574 domain-containing protein [Propylenella binzhouense]MYZ47145.1 DUF3574 domain-containing protein [Propylenella binzhouense]
MSRPRLRPSAGLLVAALLLAGCASTSREPPGDTASCTGSAWQETRLFLGRGMPGGREVSERAWNAFVAEAVAPRFRDGFTVHDARGHWLDEATGHTEAERSKVLVVLHPRERAADIALREIGEDYLARFRQQTVLRADRPVCVTFYENSRAP